MAHARIEQVLTLESNAAIHFAASAIAAPSGASRKISGHHG
jgi:hypothetical protein